jgi:kinesin family member 2/24
MQLPEINLAVVLCPQSALETSVRDVVGNEVFGGDAPSDATKRYLCALVLPGFMANTWELSLWRQVVVEIDRMQAEVFLEYDMATRYYYMTV